MANQVFSALLSVSLPCYHWGRFSLVYGARMAYECLLEKKIEEERN